MTDTDKIIAHLTDMEARLIERFTQLASQPRKPTKPRSASTISNIRADASRIIQVLGYISSVERRLLIESYKTSNQLVSAAIRSLSLPSYRHPSYVHPVTGHPDDQNKYPALKRSPLYRPFKPRWWKYYLKPVVCVADRATPANLGDYVAYKSGQSFIDLEDDDTISKIIQELKNDGTEK